MLKHTYFMCLMALEICTHAFHRIDAAGASSLVTVTLYVGRDEHQ